MRYDKVLRPDPESNMSSSRYTPVVSLQNETVKETLDLSAIPSNVPSLCIPRVFPNISQERVEAVFRKLDIGRVERIDMVERTNDKGETWKRVFVHLQWNDGETASRARERLLCGNDVKIIYEDPWFWKVSANRSTKEPRDGSRDNLRPRDSYESRDGRGLRDSRGSRDSRGPRPRDNHNHPGPRRSVDRAPPRVPSEEPRTPDHSPPRSKEVCEL